MTFLLLVALVCHPIERDVHGKIARPNTAVHAFTRANPCPGGPDKGSKTRCHGYVVDHVVPLCLGGKNDPSNMQWQSAVDGHAKDKAEVALCKWYYKACGWEW